MNTKKEKRRAMAYKNSTSNRPNGFWVSYCPTCGERIKTGVEASKASCSKKHVWKLVWG